MQKGLISRFVNKNNLSYPTRSVLKMQCAKNIFFKNDPVGENNRERLNELNGLLYTTNAIDKISPEIKHYESQIEVGY